MSNNFKRENHIRNSGYHLLIVYKPEHAAMNGANAKNCKYYHCFTKRGQKDVEGLIRRMVHGRKSQYVKALLYSKSDDKCIRKWLENGVECSQAEVDEVNNRRNNPRK